MEAIRWLNGKLGLKGVTNRDIERYRERDMKKKMREMEWKQLGG